MIANKGSSRIETNSSVDNPAMEPAERSQKSIRLFSFRKKNVDNATGEQTDGETVTEIDF